MPRLRAAWLQLEGLLAPPRTDQSLGILRLGLGLQVVLYCLSLRTDWPRLFASTGTGVAGRQFAEAFAGLESRYLPTFGRLIEIARTIGLSEQVTLTLCWLLLLAAGCALLAGIFSRPAAIVAWFLHLCAVKSGGLLSYGVDAFMTIGLFYLMLSPLPDRYSLDFRRRAGRLRDPRFLGFFRRVLQLHLCLIYFFSGLSKLLGTGWWNGSNLWRALIRPPLNVVPPELLIRFQYLLPALGIGICLLEFAYPLMIWSRRTRLPWLLAICGMHLAIGFTMGMPLFALVMIVLNVSAFWPERRAAVSASVSSGR